jgi:hypothetical protein
LIKNTRGWLILVFLALDIMFMAVILPGAQASLEAASGGNGPIDLQFFYTPEKVYGMIDSYGPEARASYRVTELTTDILYPIAYTLAYSMLITWLFQRGFGKDSFMQRLNVAPFGAWLFDLLENVGIVSMLSIFPAQPAALAWVTTVFTLGKWVFAFSSIALMLVGIVAAIIGAFRKKM